jgi:hypothetical protein
MTDYAGKSSTLNAVATTAHCAIDGYMPAIEASQSLLSPSISWFYLRVDLVAGIKAVRKLLEFCCA